jgi:hypothetical protein
MGRVRTPWASSAGGRTDLPMAIEVIMPSSAEIDMMRVTRNGSGEKVGDKDVHAGCWLKSATNVVLIGHQASMPVLTSVSHDQRLA